MRLYTRHCDTVVRSASATYCRPTTLLAAGSIRYYWCHLRCVHSIARNACRTHTHPLVSLHAYTNQYKKRSTLHPARTGVARSSRVGRDEGLISHKPYTCMSSHRSFSAGSAVVSIIVKLNKNSECCKTQRQRTPGCGVTSSSSSRHELVQRGSGTAGGACASVLTPDG